MYIICRGQRIFLSKYDTNISYEYIDEVMLKHILFLFINNYLQVYLFD